MFFLMAPINGFLVVVYFLIFHTNYLLILALIAIMGIMEWNERDIAFIDDERKMV